MPSSRLITRVCLVAAYFGRLPSWFPIWVRSCAANESFDWLLFTDTRLDELPILPQNLKAVHISFTGMKALICDRLGMEVCVPRPYKLCDFKLAYGVIFADWLKDYDFWGFCDLDVVWGDLQSFFPDEVFSSFDKIQEAGHLTFCRNVERINMLFIQPAPHLDYRQIFTNPRTYLFDEWGGAHDLTYLSGISHVWIRKHFDVDYDQYRLCSSAVRNYKRQLFYWEDGHIYRDFVDEDAQVNGSYEYPVVSRDEFSYIHLQKRILPAPEFIVAAARGFYITPFGFVQKLKSEHCLADFIRLNPRSLTYKPKARLKRLALKAKLRAFDLLKG